MADQVADKHIYFLAAAAKDCEMTWTTNHNEATGRGWSVSQSRHMSAIFGGSCRWLHLRRVVVTGDLIMVVLP